MTDRSISADPPVPKPNPPPPGFTYEVSLMLVGAFLMGALSDPKRAV
jgi:hypothetical protein